MVSVTLGRGSLMCDVTPAYSAHGLYESRSLETCSLGVASHIGLAPRTYSAELYWNSIDFFF